MFQRILWATDFSAHAEDAGRKVLDCGECAHHAVDVLTVVDPGDLPAFLLDVPDPFVTEGEVEAVERRLDRRYEERVRSHLHEATQFLRDAGVSTTLHVRVGTPSEEIVRLADQLGSDVIMLGAHGKHGLAGVLLGSTVDHVAERANCPVLVVR